MKTLFKKIALAVALFIGASVPAFAVDITITPSSVVPTATTVMVHGTCGPAATVTAGAAVYLDVNGFVTLAQANSAGASSIIGIALDGCSPNQPITYATGGHVTYNAGFTKAAPVYISQGAAGGLTVFANITSTNFPVLVGVPTSTTDLLIGFTDPVVAL